MADGSTKRKDEDPKWRRLAPDFGDTVSHDLAAVLVLHHLRLAASFFGALDIEAGPEDVGRDGNLKDPLAFNLRSNEERFKLVMHHLKKRYPEKVGNEDFQDAVVNFVTAINLHWDDVWHQEYGPGEPSAEIVPDENNNPKAARQRRILKRAVNRLDAAAAATEAQLNLSGEFPQMPGDYMTRAVSEEEIMAKCTPRSMNSGQPAWTAAQLAEWGVPWPPPHGWKAVLISNHEARERG